MSRFILFLFFTTLLHAQSANLTIYWIDTEGGAATLIVTPSGQSLLADTGNPGPNDRDAKGIFEVAQLAGLKQIDILLTTHYHSDPVGGAPALTKMIPIARYLDHGDSIEMEPAAAKLYNDYKAIADGKRTTVKPGDTTENQRSAGFLLTCAKFKFVDLGDLTWDKEMELACAVNKLGAVTLLQATHHGF